jgi:hypothetical protein
MTFRLFKPQHGWRMFAGEVGIIVLGVLIALAAQQLVDTIHRRSDVAQLVAALRSELSDDRSRWEHIRGADPCTLQRLDALERWYRTAPAGATIDRPYRLFLWNMHSSAWDLAKTSPATADLPLDQRLTFASLYGAIDNWRPLIDEESKNAQEMNALFVTADQPENRSQIPFHISKARGFVARRQFNYEYFFARFDELRVKPDESQMTVRPNDRLLCAPLAG